MTNPNVEPLQPEQPGTRPESPPRPRLIGAPDVPPPTLVREAAAVGQDVPAPTLTVTPGSSGPPPSSGGGVSP